MQFANLRRIKGSSNQEQAIKDFFYSKIERVEEQPKASVLGASKLGCCKYQAVRNICSMFNLNKGESN